MDLLDKIMLCVFGFIAGVVVALAGAMIIIRQDNIEERLINVERFNEVQNGLILENRK